MNVAALYYRRSHRETFSALLSVCVFALDALRFVASIGGVLRFRGLYIQTRARLVAGRCAASVCAVRCACVIIRAWPVPNGPGKPPGGPHKEKPREDCSLRGVAT